MSISSRSPKLWAKTLPDGSPGVSVSGHCVNVGRVGEAILESLPESLKSLVPVGVQVLIALHDVGKASIGFQSKCDDWLKINGLAEESIRDHWKDPVQCEHDHAKLSQWILQERMKSSGSKLWAVAAGSHHGRIFGRQVAQPNLIANREEWENEFRNQLIAELVSIFGDLPTTAPRTDHADLWFVAGLVSVADWIGSNERFFSPAEDLSPEDARRKAQEALNEIHWKRGRFRDSDFKGLFAGYDPKPLQTALHDLADRPGLFIVEGPMGCGKTEAALWAAYRLCASSSNDGFYFALPTQVTSNRIHERVSGFLSSALASSSTLRLAHGASWLREDHSIVLHPSCMNDAAQRESVHEGRSWFASAKHALLAAYGVGTVDQALQGVVAVKHFFVRRFGLAGKVVILDEVHSYDVYTGTLITRLVRELLALNCSVIILSATLTRERRRELLECSGCTMPDDLSEAYPLVTAARMNERLVERASDPGASREVNVTARHFNVTEILDECLKRAEAGQHVLYIRNTVAEAQDSHRAFAGAMREDSVELGLLHSRFPFFRRQEIESRWLDRLGKQRPEDGKGSILVATQVVEQSVDIDLDFIVSDLAPTDMLLQRMGRLWRHERRDRLDEKPDFWIHLPLVPENKGEREIRKALGKSGRVYAPYVLLRAIEVFSTLSSIMLPHDIRKVLEATYAARSDEEEPPGWVPFRDLLMHDRRENETLAKAASEVFRHQSQKDAEGLLTRRNGAPTIDLVLLRSCEQTAAGQWRIRPLEGEEFTVSGYEWSYTAAKTLHLNLVRAPSHSIPRPLASTPWLALHLHSAAAFALVDEVGKCEFPDVDQQSTLAYGVDLGLHSRESGHQQPPVLEDDEFDY
jgi:CRISPR-associated endonuclease/helicase Cas3